MHCPEVSCKKPIPTYLLKDLLNKEYLEKYYEASFKLAAEIDPTMSWCPTPDCSYVFYFEEEQIEHRCPLCQKYYCLDCRTDYHVGLTCVEYQQKVNEEMKDQ